jgi:hypothetical protein
MILGKYILMKKYLKYAAIEALFLSLWGFTEFRLKWHNAYIFLALGIIWIPVSFIAAQNEKSV